MQMYIHVQSDGGIFVLNEDLKAAYVSKSGLLRRLDEVQKSGGKVLYSRDECASNCSHVIDLFAVIESYKIPIQMVQPIPEVLNRPVDYVTPLIHAAYTGDHAWLQELIDWGIDLEVRDRFGQTALMMAADAGQLRSVKMLIQAGANSNALAPDGSTPLMFASQHGHTEIVHELLKNGANSTARGSHGYDAIGLANRNAHSAVVSLLEGR